MADSANLKALPSPKRMTGGSLLQRRILRNFSIKTRLTSSKPGDYYENTYFGSDSLLTDVHGSCSSLPCPSRLGSGHSHHVPVHRQPLHRRVRPLHHERLRDGNGDVGGPTGSEHAAHRCHITGHRFHFVRRGANNN